MVPPCGEDINQQERNFISHFHHILHTWYFDVRPYSTLHEQNIIFTCGPLATDFLLPNIPHDDVALLREQTVDDLTFVLRAYAFEVPSTHKFPQHNALDLYIIQQQPF